MTSPRLRRLSTLHTPRHWLLCQRLRAARERAGLTQAQAADALGHPQNYVSKIERSQRKLEALELAEFAELYRTPIAELIPAPGAATPLPIDRRVAEPRVAPGPTGPSKAGQKRPPSEGPHKKRSQAKRAPKRSPPGKGRTGRTSLKKKPPKESPPPPEAPPA